MNENNLFHWIGEKLGAVIRLVVDALAWLFGHLYGAFDSFIAGLTSALGISSSVFSVAILVIGVAMLCAAVSALPRRRFMAALVWTLLGLLVLTWLIH